MGRWDVLLPFLAPGRSVGSVAPRSHRDPTDAASRSLSRSSSSQGTAASPRAEQLPDVEDIYDLLTSESCLLRLVTFLYFSVPHCRIYECLPFDSIQLCFSKCEIRNETKTCTLVCHMSGKQLRIWWILRRNWRPKDP